MNYIIRKEVKAGIRKQQNEEMSRSAMYEGHTVEQSSLPMEELMDDSSLEDDESSGIEEEVKENNMDEHKQPSLDSINSSQRQHRKTDGEVSLNFKERKLGELKDSNSSS